MGCYGDSRRNGESNMVKDEEVAPYLSEAFSRYASGQKTTVPVSAGDPTVTYGASDGIVRLSETGTDITIDEAGTYRIELDLSTPFYD